MTQRTKWLGLTGLALVWLALVYVFVIDVPPPQEVPLKFKSGQSAASTMQKGLVESWDVKSLHAKARELPVTPKKNIFAPPALPLSPEAQVRLVALKKKNAAAAVPPPEATPPPPPPSPSPEELVRQQEALAAQAVRQQEELRRKQVQEQMAQYRYLGYLNQSGVQKAFLGKGREIYIIRQGDTLDGKFLVALIEATAVKIREADSNLEIILKLKKEEGLVSET